MIRISRLLPYPNLNVVHLIAEMMSIRGGIPSEIAVGVYLQLM